MKSEAVRPGIRKHSAVCGEAWERAAGQGWSARTGDHVCASDRPEFKF